MSAGGFWPGAAVPSGTAGNHLAMTLIDPLRPAVSDRSEETELANFPKKRALALVDDRRFNRLQSTHLGAVSRLGFLLGKTII